MEKPDFKKAREAAEAMLKRNAVRSAPIDPEALAEAEGIDVVYVEFGESTRNLVSGLYDYETNKIYINKDQAANRMTFTIAHELAHAVMHRDYAKSNNYKAMPRSNVHVNKPAVEKEADVFAAHLLVPPKTLRRYKDIATTEELATLFAVSPEVVKIQLSFL